MVDFEIYKKEAFAFGKYSAIINPWQHSGNSSSESHGNYVIEIKTSHIASKTLINSVKF